MRAARQVLIACVILISGHAVAADTPALPGIGAADRRVVVDPNAPPWDAVVKVQSNIASRCTGTLIGPTTVLTAAHCLYNGRTRALLQSVSLHVLVGYQRGAFRWHRLVARYAVGPGFDGAKPPPQTADWARLELSEPVPPTVAPVAIAKMPPRPGLPIAVAGYNQDRAQLLMVDQDCRIEKVVSQSGGTLLSHDCSATRGTSGGPVLTREDKGWAMIGLNIAAGARANVALAVPVESR